MSRKTRFARQRERRQARRNSWPHAFIDTAHGLVECQVIHATDWNAPGLNCRVRVTRTYAFGQITYAEGEIIDRPLLMVVPAACVFVHGDRRMIGIHSWPETVRSAG